MAATGVPYTGAGLRVPKDLTIKSTKSKGVDVTLSTFFSISLSNVLKKHQPIISNWPTLSRYCYLEINIDQFSLYKQTFGRYFSSI